MTKRAAIYARVSSERQANEDRVSIEVQLADCEAYCRERGYAVVARYVDKDKYRSKGKLVQPSGQRKDRPGYQAMLKAAREGGFDVVVAWKEDRLYRGMYAALPFSEALDELGKRLDAELVKETFDRKMLGIKAALGKIEVDNIRERMLMGRRARLERGEVPGGDQVRYGYRKQDRRLEIEEDEARWVRKIYGWYNAGENNMQIRRRLNALGVPARRGKRWAKPTIETILTTEGYATGKLTTVLDGQSYEIPCPPIISVADWKKAVETRAGNRSIARNVKEDYLCLGLVYCACGWKCHGVTNRAARRRGYPTVSGYYDCQRRNQDPESMSPQCSRLTGSKKVDDFVWQFVVRLCDDPDLLREAIARKITELEGEQADQDAAVDQLQKMLDDLSIERQWVITQARRKAITEDDMGMQLSALQIQEWSYRKELEEAQGKVAARQHAEALGVWVAQYLSDIGAGVRLLNVKPETLTGEQRSALAAELDAARFSEKFPDDTLARLRWAILEEKRRVVRTLISRVVVERQMDGKRKITPILAFDIPVQAGAEGAFLASGYQSPDYQAPEDSAPYGLPAATGHIGVN